MNSGSSGMVTDDTVTTGTSGTGRAGVEAASCLQPSGPVRTRTTREPSRLKVSLCIRFGVFTFTIDRAEGIIQSFRTSTPSSHVHNLIYDAARQTTGGDEFGPLLMDLLQ